MHLQPWRMFKWQYLIIIIIKEQPQSSSWSIEYFLLIGKNTQIFLFIKVKSSETFTFFTSARRSFFRTGLFLASAVGRCDLHPVDPLSDSEWLSDSEELFDSEWCDRLLSLPCSLSDWLPVSDAEWLDSSEAELLQEQTYFKSSSFSVNAFSFMPKSTRWTVREITSNTKWKFRPQRNSWQVSVARCF